MKTTTDNLKDLCTHIYMYVRGISQGMMLPILTAIVVAGTGALIPHEAQATHLNCTGGTVAESGGYTTNTFTTVGNHTLNCPTAITAEVLVVGGGGGGGTGVTGYGRGGGGGGGGVVYNGAKALSANTNYSVTVGAGGVNDTNGSNSVFDNCTGAGGGAGGGNSTADDGSGGGSGGGGQGYPYGNLSGGAGWQSTAFNGSPYFYNCSGTGYGNAGAAGSNGGGFSGANGGGGGGAGAAATNVQGAAGVSIWGTYYAGGGGGGHGGGGGAGGGGYGNGVAGTANTGGGGGGSPEGGTIGGTGGSGIVIVRYPTPNNTPSNLSVSPSSGSYPAGARTFTTVYRDLDWATNISGVHFLMNYGVDGNNTSFYGYYIPSTNACHIFNSDNAASPSWPDQGWSPNVNVFGAQGFSWVTLNSCSATTFGSDLTVTWNLTFNTWTENLNQYLYAWDTHSAATGWTYHGNIWADTTAPGAPGVMTTSWTGDHYVKTNFVAKTTGATDTGSGIASYSLCRSNDNAGGCSAWVATGLSAATAVTNGYTVSGADLPSNGAYRYYYWYAYDAAGNQSANSTGEYVRMDTTAPSHDSISVSNASWVTNSGTYNITLLSTESGVGFGGSYGMMALINYQGANSANNRGYFAWHPSSYVHDADRIACTGGGYGSKSSSYGGGTITLTACSTSLSGSQRTVVFTVQPNINFGNFADNDISFYTSDALNNMAGWTNFATNGFSSAGAQAALTVTNTTGTYPTGFNLSTSGGSGTGAVTYALVAAGTAGCSVNAATGAVTFTSVGTCTVNATKAADSLYSAVTSANTTVTINKADQAALNLSAQTVTYPNGFAELSTTGGSGTGAVSYAVTSAGAGCSISGTTLSYTTAGTCGVTATKAGDTNYNAASSAQQTFTINKANQAALNFSGQTVTYPTGFAALSTTGGSGTGAVSYAVTSAGAGCSISGTTLSYTTAGTCGVTATKAADTNYNAASSAQQTFTINKADQAALTLTNTTGTYGAALTVSSSGGSGTGAVTFAVTDAGTANCSVNATTGAVTFSTAGTCTMTATKAADVNYNATSSVATTVTINKADQAAVNFSGETVTYPNGFAALSTTGGSGTGAVSYAVTSAGAGCSVSGTTLSYTTAGSCGVTATKAADTNYNAASSAQQTFTINAAVPIVATTTVTAIGITRATMGGTVVSAGGTTLTARGTCWGTDASPVTNCSAEGGTAAAAFSHLRTGLASGTVYYVRAYATNSAGTGYSADTTFTTQAPPLVTDATVTAVSSSTATMGATLATTGGTTIDARGTCWGTDASPTGNCAAVGGTGLGAFTHSRTGLTEKTALYIRGYATYTDGAGMAGTAYSSDISTTTHGVPTVGSPTVSSVGSSQATFGGTVTDAAGAPVTDRGTCIGTDASPSGNCVSEGSGLGLFTQLRTGLSPETLYYMRAYATNLYGTGYSNDVSTTTRGTQNAYLVSASNQTFVSGQAPAGIAQITVTDPSGTVTVSNDIRIAINTSVVDMQFDTTDTTATFGGSASEKVSNPVTYEGNGVLVIPVSVNFQPEDTLTIGGLSYRSFGAVNTATTALSILTGGAGSSTVSAYDTKTVAIIGSMTLTDHSREQMKDQFNATSIAGIPVFAFRLVPSGEDMTVGPVVFRLKDVTGIQEGEITGAKLYVDGNGTKAIDGGLVQVGGAGTVAVNGKEGTVTFSETFVSATAKDYILVFDAVNLEGSDRTVISLSTSDVTTSGAVTGAVTETGSVPDVLHIRVNIGGGTGSNTTRQALGEETAPTDTVVTVGGTSGDGGGAIDPDSGTTIGSEAGFNAPSGSGSPFDNWTNRLNAYVSDGSYTTTAGAGSQVSYGTFNFSVPTGNTITGIEVKLEASASTANGNISTKLSWNGGADVTAAKTTGTLTQLDDVYRLGGTSDTWGRSWTAGEFANGNFQIEVIGNASQNTINLDAVQVKVYHQSTGGTKGGGGAVFSGPNTFFANVYSAMSGAAEALLERIFSWILNE